MAKAVLDSLDGLSDDLKGEYESRDGKFFLKVEGIEQMPAFAAQRNKVTELLDEVKGSKRVLKKHGLIVDKIEEDALDTALGELKTKADAKGTGATAEKVQALEARITEISTNAQREVAQAKEDAAKARTAAENSFIEREIALILGDKEIDGSPALLTSVMKPLIKAKEVDGKFVAVVVRPDGTERIKDSQNNPFSLKDLALELRGDPQYGRAFNADATSGGGAPPSGGGGGGGGGGQINPWKSETKNITEQMRIARENPALAKTMAAQAGIKLNLEQ